MISEPKLDAEKQPFRFPVLVTLVPKRRLKIALAEQAETELLHLNSEEPTLISSTGHQRRLKRSGRVILHWPSRPAGPIPASPVGTRCIP